MLEQDYISVSHWGMFPDYGYWKTEVDRILRASYKKFDDAIAKAKRQDKQ